MTKLEEINKRIKEIRREMRLDKQNKKLVKTYYALHREQLELMPEEKEPPALSPLVLDKPWGKRKDLMKKA